MRFIIVPIVVLAIAIFTVNGKTIEKYEDSSAENEDSTTNLPEPTPSDDFDCPNMEEGYYLHPSECHIYYHCIHGLAWERICPDGLHFNVQGKYCDFPEFANCPYI